MFFDRGGLLRRGAERGLRDGDCRRQRHAGDRFLSALPGRARNGPYVRKCVGSKLELPLQIDENFEQFRTGLKTLEFAV